MDILSLPLGLHSATLYVRAKAFIRDTLFQSACISFAEARLSRAAFGFLPPTPRGQTLHSPLSRNLGGLSRVDVGKASGAKCVSGWTPGAGGSRGRDYSILRGGYSCHKTPVCKETLVGTGRDSRRCGPDAPAPSPLALTRGFLE